MSAIFHFPVSSIFLIAVLFALFLLAVAGFERALDRWLDRFNQVRQASDEEKSDDRA
jgi:hypothetical protein